MEPEERLRPELAVADVVYNLLETLLVKKVKEAGCRAAIGGSYWRNHSHKYNQKNLFSVFIPSFETTYL